MKAKKTQYLMRDMAWSIVKAEDRLLHTGFCKDRLPSYHKEVMDIEAGAKAIESLLLGDAPAMICRLGAVELMVMNNFEKVKLGIKRSIPSSSLEQLRLCAGFFPAEQAPVGRFCALMSDCLGQSDLLGIWKNPMEDYFARTYAPQSSLCVLRSLEPWYAQQPWTRVLKGKKVVVVHPFADSITAQYRNRHLLFENDALLPDFQLRVVKAVQSAGGNTDPRFETWFDALEYMYGEVCSEAFDVAILGCGAYGFPLAAKIKKNGGKAVHLGGATQLLFGIKGSRWDNHPIIGKLYNDDWVRPMGCEKPDGAENVENGCYW